MNADYFRMLFDYNYWAHRRVWDCIIQLTDEQFSHDIGYSWRSIHGQVVHTMGAEWIWFSRIQGTSPTAMFKNEDYPTRDAVRARWDEIEANARAYLANLEDSYLGQTIHYQTTSGKPMSNRLWHILAHLANHGTDHRAQILAMLHQLGTPTLEQDIIFYLRERER